MALGLSPSFLKMLGIARLPLLSHFLRSHRISYRRIYSLTTGRPLEVIVLPPPTPPYLPKPRPLREAIPVKWEYKEIELRHYTHIQYIRGLISDLRLAFRKAISWPSPDTPVGHMSLPQYIQEILLQPVAGLFNQAYQKNIHVRPCLSTRNNESVYVFTFEADDFLKRPNQITSSPIVAFIPEPLFDQEGTPSGRMLQSLDRIYDEKPHSYVICTNLEEIFVFWAPKAKERFYERISTSKPLLAIRIISAAYLDHTLSCHSYIPSPDDNPDEGLILPEGPPVDPNELPDDREVFNTHVRHSDFDLPTLMRDRGTALQFLRWKEHIQATKAKQVTFPDDILSATTNAPMHAVPEIIPYYPFHLSDTTSDTLDHLRSIQRVCPLSTAGNLSERLQKSRKFEIQILGLVSKGSDGGICSVYRCKLISIDGDDVESPTICLKLFDDRFQRIELPDEYESQEDAPAHWFDKTVVAELHLRQEDSAYKKLTPVQGSIVPWYYGCHLFTLPSGLSLHGILLEYTPGVELDSDEVGGMPSERQIQLIQSCRHGARVLDVADIVQHDWHPHQIIVHTTTKGDITHAIFIDFASVTQTIEPDVFTYLFNFTGCLVSLTGGLGHVTISRELAIEHFGDPDHWYAATLIVPRKPNKESVVFKAPDPFPFIQIPSSRGSMNVVSR